MIDVILHKTMSCETMKKIIGKRNPFVTEGYVGRDYFCDRKSELEDVLTALRGGRNLTLYSPRRMGKSGLIHRAFEELAQEARCYYLDIMHTRSLRDFSQMLSRKIIGSMDDPLEKVAQKVSKFFTSFRPVMYNDELTGQLKISLEVLPGKEEHSLEETFHYIEQSGEMCYIAFDEFQQIANYDGVNAEALLRSYVQFIPNCHFVFSGSKTHLMQEMFTSPKRPFYQSTQPLSLKEISREAYYDFALRLFSEAGIDLRVEAFDYIYNSVFGHTWYVQYWLSKMYDIADTYADVKTAKEALYKIMDEMEDNFETYVNLLTEPQLQVMVALSREGMVEKPRSNVFVKKHDLPGPSTISACLKKLVDDDMVLLQKGGYSVYDRFFMRWLNQQKI